MKQGKFPLVAPHGESCESTLSGWCWAKPGIRWLYRSTSSPIRDCLHSLIAFRVRRSFPWGQRNVVSVVWDMRPRAEIGWTDLNSIRERLVCGIAKASISGDRFWRICVYTLIASQPCKPNLRNIGWNLTQPITSDRSLSDHTLKRIV